MVKHGKKQNLVYHLLAVLAIRNYPENVDMVGFLLAAPLGHAPGPLSDSSESMLGCSEKWPKFFGGFSPLLSGGTR